MKFFLVLGALLFLAAPAFASQCQVIFTATKSCINGCSVPTTTFRNDPIGTACYKYQGATVSCPCGGTQFTATAAGVCNEEDNLCNWWVMARPTKLSKQKRHLLITRRYRRDCEGNLRLVLSPA
jgi:hypothetical protein